VRAARAVSVVDTGPVTREANAPGRDERAAAGTAGSAISRDATRDIIELTRSIYEVRAPFSPAAYAEAFTRYHAADVVWESVGLGTTFSGRDATRQFVADWLARFEDYELLAEEIADLGNGVVLAKSGHAGRPIGSPEHAWLPREVLVHSYVWEDGVITHVVSSGDTPQARAAAERLAQERGRPAPAAS